MKANLTDAKPEEMGTTGLVALACSSFRGAWQNFQKACGVIRRRYGAGRVPLFARAVAAYVARPEFSRHFQTKVTRYTVAVLEGASV